MQKLLWSPSPSFIKNSHLKKFENWLSKKHGLVFKDYDEIWEWSVRNTELFWSCVADYFEIIFHDKPKGNVMSGAMPKVKWFGGATLNYSEHIFKSYSDSRPAIYFKNELHQKIISWKELKDQVAKIRAYLVDCGIEKGDRVCAYLPNIPEAIFCFLAVNSLGAIWSCCSPDFGVETVLERFVQIEPKLLIACDGYQYGGKQFQRLNEVNQIKNAIPSIQHSLLIPYLDLGAKLQEFDQYNSLNLNVKTNELQFEPVEFNHPIWILYSSGTTGKPKAITHSHGGILLEHYKYMAFHNDVHEGENYFWFSTTGWMMWNFMLSSLLLKASLVIYDGSPGYPDMEVLWNYAEEVHITHFGTSAPYLTACLKRGLDIKNKYDLSFLRSISSTGAPLPEETFEYVYESIASNIWLCSMSGGTDVCTAFMGGHPYKNVYAGLIQSRALACAMQAYNDEGISVIGELGEMVIEQAMPSMPVFFWNDKDFTRYKASYFENYKGKWRHGDWIKIYGDGSIIIRGRSDATLNRKGIRIGTAEIYSVLNKIDEIRDALIINIEREDGSDFMPLFIITESDSDLTDTLIKKINKALRTQCSPRHVPDEIIRVPEIPYTLSGKKLEVPVKKIFLGIDPMKSLNKDALRNPSAIDFFIQLKQSGTFN